jgi:hypothetical protein
MAETLISPGVLARENDTSQVTSQPVQAGAAIIGPTVKGPVGIPTVVTTYSQFQQKFGTTFTSGNNSDILTYFTSIAAYNYFTNGGTSLLVSRVVSGSYTSANTGTSGDSISGSTGFGANPVLVLETIAKGADQNSSSSLDDSGSLFSGSADNLRYQIANWNTSSGTFSLLIRKGNDNTLNQTVLETWTNLSLDPFSPNFVSKVIGDQTQTFVQDGTSYYLQTTGSYPGGSNYVRVKSVVTTPGYFDNTGIPKPQYTASIPINRSGSFRSATGVLGAGSEYYDGIITADKSQGIPIASNNGQGYPDMINLLSNKDDYRFNILLAPGLFNNLQTGLISNIISTAEDRGDFIFVNDLYTYGATISQTTGQAISRNTSYAASYWPWVQTQDPDSGRNVWVPASTVIGGVYAYNDRVAEPWFAPAGINRGGLSVIRAERKLSQTDRDTLYQNKVNPIATFPGQGVVVYGQKTLQTQASALDRVNVRRLLIALKNYISQVANNLVFEQNTTTTRNNFLAQVNPYLESVQQRQGLFAFRVVMDESNNTAADIDRNQLNGGIYVQPTKTAEFIYLDFNITPTGATFPV